jgi:hypothetical protein
MGSEVAASSAQLKHASEGGGGECDSVSGGGSRSTVDMEDIGGGGGLLLSSSCVCVLLSTVTVGTGGGGLIGVGVGLLTAVSVSLVEALASTNDGGSVWVLESSQAGGCSPSIAIYYPISLFISSSFVVSLLVPLLVSFI